MEGSDRELLNFLCRRHRHPPTSTHPKNKPKAVSSLRAGAPTGVAFGESNVPHASPGFGGERVAPRCPTKFHHHRGFLDSSPWPTEPHPAALLHVSSTLLGCPQQGCSVQPQKLKQVHEHDPGLVTCTINMLRPHHSIREEAGLGVKGAKRWQYPLVQRWDRGIQDGYAKEIAQSAPEGQKTPKVSYRFKTFAPRGPLSGMKYNI